MLDLNALKIFAVLWTGTTVLLEDSGWTLSGRSEFKALSSFAKPENKFEAEVELEPWSVCLETIGSTCGGMVY